MPIASNGQQAEKQAMTLCFWLGAWGVLTGFALFLLLVEQLDRPWVFVAALGIAVVASYVIEWVRHLIEEQGDARPAGPRVLSTVLLIVIAELFVGALEALPEVSPLILSALSELFLGDLAASLMPPWVSLVAVGLAWMVAGGAIAQELLRGLDASWEGPGRIARGAWCGARVGALVGPLMLVICVLALRALANVYMMVGHYEEWTEHLARISDIHPLLGLIVLPVKWLGGLWTEFAWGPYAVGAIVVAALWSLRTERPFGAWLLSAVMFTVALPLLADLVDLLWILLLGAVVWAIPTAAIGAFAPLLREPSKDTRTWGGVALAGAALLTLLTLLRLSSWWFLLPAALLALTALLLRRNRSAEEWWPLLALTTSLTVAGVTWIFQQATFEGIFERVHAISTPNLDPPPPLMTLDPGMLERIRILPVHHGAVRDAFDRASRIGWLDDASYARVQKDLAAQRKTATGGAALALTGVAVEVRTFHTTWQSAARKQGLERLAPMEALLKHMQAKLKPELGRVLVLDTPIKQAAWRYWNRAEKLLGSDVTELRAAQRIASTQVPADPTDLAEQLDLASFGRTNWRVPGLRDIAKEARARLEAQTPTVEAVTLERLRPRPGMDIATLEALGREASKTPWQTEAAQHVAVRIGTQIAEARDQAAAALDTRLRDQAAALETAPPLSRVAEADRVLAEIENASAPLPDGALKTLLAKRADRLTAQRDAWRSANKRDAIRLLELAICGSLGFWVCVGLLGGWALRRRED